MADPYREWRAIRGSDRLRRGYGRTKGNRMKYMTIAACIVLVAGGACYGATQHAIYMEQKERTPPMRDAENAFYDAAGAKEGETGKVRMVCENFARDPAKDAQPVKSFLSKCRQFGFL